MRVGPTHMVRRRQPRGFQDLLEHSSAIPRTSRWLQRFSVCRIGRHVMYQSICQQKRRFFPIFSACGSLFWPFQADKKSS